MVEEQASSGTIPSAMKNPILTVDSNQATKLINGRLVSGKHIVSKLQKEPYAEVVYKISQELERWDIYNSTLLMGMFTTPVIVGRYNNCAQSLKTTAKNYLKDPRHILEWFSSKEAELISIKNRLPLFDIAPKSRTVKSGAAKIFGNKVFIVHGHERPSKSQLLVS